MNWLHYLLEANIYLSVFYLLYYILLRNVTYNKANRVYLLSACILAFIIPVVQIGILRPADVHTPVIETIDTVMLQQTATRAAAPVDHLKWQDLLVYAYILGELTMLCLFISKIRQLYRISRANKVLSRGDHKLVILEDSNAAFSFLNYMFIGAKLKEVDRVTQHELVHLYQKHSYDIIFLELIKIVNWFNPFVYLLQRSMRALHEFIADEQTAALENDTLAYSSFLLNNAYGLNGPAVTHSFFNGNLLKKRIIMLNKKRSGNSARLKYLVALPIFAAMLCASTFVFSKNYGWLDIAPAKAATANKTVKNDTVYSVVETLPEFPGGMQGLLNYVAKNTKYPQNAVKNKIEGKVIINFIIEKDGSVTNVKPYRGVSPDLDKEAIRVISSLPKWKPGAQHGKPVRTAYTMPIAFKLPPQ